MKFNIALIILVLTLLGCTASPALPPTIPVIVSSPTLTPTLTSTPLPALAPTSVKLAYEPINVDNIDRLTKIKTLGFGEPLEIHYTSDGKKIALIMREKICFLDATTLEVLSCIETNIQFASLSDDAQTLAILNYETLNVLDTASGEVLTHIKLPAEVLPQWMTTLKNFMSPDGKYVLAPTTDGLYLWDAHTGNLIQVFEGEFYGRSYGFSTDSKYLVISNKNITMLWDLEQKSEIAKIVLNEAPSGYDQLSYFFSPRGTYIAIALGSSVHVYRISDQKHVWYWAGNSPISEVAFSGDDSLISVATVSDTNLNVWNLETGQIVQRLRLSSSSDHGVGSVKISPDGKFISAAGEPWAYNNRSKSQCTYDNVKTSIYLWSVETGELIMSRPRPGHCDTYPIYFSFSPDSQSFLYFSEDHENFAPTDLNLFSLRDKSVAANLPLLLARSAVLKDENTLIVGSGDGRVLEVDVLSGKSKLLMGDTQKGFDGSNPLVTNFAMSPDAQKIAVGTSNASILVNDLQNDTTQEIWRGKKGITTMSFSADNQYLAFDGDGLLQVWDFKANAFMNLPSEIKVDQLIFSPKDNYLITVGTSRYFNGSSNHEVSVWKLPDFSEPIAPAVLVGNYRGLKVSHSGDFFVSDFSGGTSVLSQLIYFPNVTGEQFNHREQEPPGDYVLGKALSPDDRLFAAWIRISPFDTKEVCRIEIWDIQKQAVVRSIPVHCAQYDIEYARQNSPIPMFFSPDGTMLFVGTDIGYGIQVYGIK